MTLIIEVTPEVQSRLEEEAARRGLNAGEYAGELLQDLLVPHKQRPFYETATREEWERAFDAWIDSHDPTRPPLPPEALTREHMYGSRG